MSFRGDGIVLERNNSRRPGVISRGPRLDVIVLWTGKYVFHTEIQIIRPNGSGDSTFGYVRVFCFAALAVAAALVWTLLARKRHGHARLYEWLRVYVRFALAAAMISYGAAKVIPSQFAHTPGP